MSIDQTISRIAAFRIKKGWNLSQLARAAGLRESTIRKIDDPNWNPERKTIKKLEAVIEAERGA